MIHSMSVSVNSISKSDMEYSLLLGGVLGGKPLREGAVAIFCFATAPYEMLWLYNKCWGSEAERQRYPNIFRYY